VQRDRPGRGLHHERPGRQIDATAAGRPAGPSHRRVRAEVILSAILALIVAVLGALLALAG
jgi:hypothetical protein